MPKTPSVPEQKTPPKPQPELKRPSKPEPEIKYPPQTETEILEKEDQADSGPDKDNPVTRSKAGAARTVPDPQDAHIGATEDQVSDTQAPAGDAYEDEPRQG
jgi:hypothetical protein